MRCDPFFKVLCVELFLFAIVRGSYDRSPENYNQSSTEKKIRTSADVNSSSSKNQLHHAVSTDTDDVVRQLKRLSRRRRSAIGLSETIRYERPSRRSEHDVVAAFNELDYYKYFKYSTSPKKPTTSPPQKQSTFPPTNKRMPNPTPSQTNLITIAPTSKPSPKPSSLGFNDVVSAPPSVLPTEIVCPSNPEETAEIRAKKLTAIFEGTVVDSSSLSIPSSPQSRAAEWILHSDPARLCTSDVFAEKIAQRFILAIYYFATGGDTAWKEQRGFMESKDECLWGGVTCKENGAGFIQKLNMDENNLSGSLPLELYSLYNLTDIALDSNNLTGSISSSIAQLPLLEVLDLDKNNLSGSIPSSIYNLTSLKVLDINDNKLTGTLSSHLENLSNLVFIQLHNNFFYGEIPNSIGNLSSLDTLLLHGNDFFGTVPQTVCGLQNLKLLMSDCAEPNPKVSCSCCTHCF
mmetsp:Transcript_10836/g.23809  ORF Transcript_10836/g.23809 Transcript_10836/m.23809 type:complete len:461 (-) Transcript_10836:105-1487(-)